MFNFDGVLMVVPYPGDDAREPLVYRYRLLSGAESERAVCSGCAYNFSVDRDTVGPRQMYDAEPLHERVGFGGTISWCQNCLGDSWAHRFNGRLFQARWDGESFFMYTQEAGGGDPAKF